MRKLLLFEELDGQPFGYVDLDTEARLSPRYDHFAACSPMLAPAVAQAFLEDVHRRHGWSWSYGGYLEVRRYLWRGGYMAKGERYLHLGVDFNVPVGTAVFATRPMEIVLIDCDHPDEGGWGTRVIVKLLDEDAYLIYAHLSRTVIYKVGRELLPGEAFAWVGDSSQNGGWFPHLHVQALTGPAWRRYQKIGLDKLDGYGDPLTMREHAVECPHPFEYLGKWEAW